MSPLILCGGNQTADGSGRQLRQRNRLPEKPRELRPIRVKHVSFTGKQTAHFSFVTALHQSSLYTGKLLVQGAVNTGGTDMVSAYTATTRIEGFANSFGDSGSAATSVLVAQNRGAGKEERVKESFRSSLFLMLAMGLAMTLIMYVSASTSVGFMLGTRSGAAFENARDYLKLVALFYTLCFTGNTFAGYFNGIGKVSVPFLGATSHIAL